MTVSQKNRSGIGPVLGLFILAVLLVVASYILVLLMGYGFIFLTPDGQALSAKVDYFPILLLFLFGFETPGIEVGVVFAFISVVFALCFFAASQWRRSLLGVLRKPSSQPFRRFFDNFLFAMPLISGMVLIAVWLIIFAQQVVGIPTGQVAFPPGVSQQQIFLELAYAPAVEELGFRLVPIGLFTVLYVFVAGKNAGGKGLRGLVTSVLYPDGAKRMAGLRNVREHGLWRGISIGEWAMVLVTSLIFGYAHVVAGIGWEVGKITSVFVQAFFFAVCYLAYGFEAPILLHWFFNYYLFFFDPSILSNFFPFAEPVLSIVEILILALGVVGWAFFAIYSVRKLTKRKTTEQKSEVPVPPDFLSPPPPPPAPT